MKLNSMKSSSKSTNSKARQDNFYFYKNETNMLLKVAEYTYLKRHMVSTKY